MSEAVLAINDLTIDFGDTRAVDGVSLTVGRGEVVGLVGESGSGKSVTALAALGLVGAGGTVAGSVRLAGREVVGAHERDLRPLRGATAGLVFQDAASSLFPLRRVGAQLGRLVRRHDRVSREAARGSSLGLLADVGFADPGAVIDRYPHELSGGMKQRAMIAMALAGSPSLLIADEATTALDVTVQAQVMDLFVDLNRRRGVSILLISHDLAVVSDVCDRIVVMRAGRVVEEAATDDLFDHPQHPYTRALLAAAPSLDVS